jgi:hypothetical protein
MPDMSSQEMTRGLQDGFSEYLTPTTVDYTRVLRIGLIVVDTNVLLNLYRYHSTTREDLFRILEAVGQRLFVPHQVIAEFWKNRESVIRASAQETTRLKEALDGHRNGSLQSITTWAERVALPKETLDELGHALDRVYGELDTRVDAFSEESLGLDALDTNRDRVLDRLNLVLEGRIGPPVPAEEFDAACDEAERRISAEEPPGFADSAKTGQSRYGDYLVWHQLLKEATVRGVDVLLVTGDVKEDWWRREKGETRGPRLELSQELMRSAGARLFMLRPASLLARAKDALDLTINEQPRPLTG